MVITVTRMQDARPVDVELIGDSTDAALLMELGTTTRDQIDLKTPILTGHLQLLVSEDLGADEDEAVRKLFRQAYALLDLSRRPSQDAPTFVAYFYMREVATLTRRFLWVYSQRNGLSAP
ncbi:hypothetical protein [Streptomyces sp. CC53]|uniref:hypothetical protein n=1 Tax=Streptomyces sp. CC53 TaxID=1906740 RepID=UPI00210AD960|nr:hypothetical protein [Streptomyces sp. CC53]